VRADERNGAHSKSPALAADRERPPHFGLSKYFIDRLNQHCKGAGPLAAPWQLVLIFLLFDALGQHGQKHGQT
jgi:hypothetical protein